MNELRVGFVMSTEVGLKTQYLNWRNGLTPEFGIVPEWVPINWWKRDGFVERLPLIPKGIKGRLRSELELSEGLARGPYDALFVACPSVFRSRPYLLERQPYFITSDSTPRQLYSFGDLYGRSASRFALYERWKNRAQMRCYQEAVTIFPWSHWAAGSMVNDYGVSEANISVIPPGIDLQQWQVAAKSPDKGPVHILFVGGDFYRKGGDLLLDWSTQTKSRDWVLHLVTREPVKPQSENVCVYNGLSSNAPELVELYRQAHLFVLPTRGDCYSLASIEAFASGVPVILAETGGTGDIIQDGETGYLIPPGDRAALTDRLDYLVANRNLLEPMGKKARQVAETRYDVRKNIGQTLEVMRQRLGTK